MTLQYHVLIEMFFSSSDVSYRCSPAAKRGERRYARGRAKEEIRFDMRRIQDRK